MNETSGTKIRMDQILESAVVLSWKDLPQVSQDRLVHIEYIPGSPLPFLKVWQLTGKGEWSLVCEYWMSRGPAGVPLDGMTFSNGYRSAGLAEMLAVIMQHQGNFTALRTGPSAGLIQVTLPTEPENLAASGFMKHAYESLGLTYVQAAATAAA
jgi:hypothetical protein